MITTADALEVMTVVAACHHRTAPRMDDREVTLATANVWADMFNEYKLALPDLLAAVKKRGARFEVAPEPSEIIKFAREIRQDRSDRESTEQRHLREAAIDAKVEGRRDAIARFAQGFGEPA